MIRLALIAFCIVSSMVFVASGAAAATQTSCWSADRSTKISILFRDSGTDRGLRADALELSRKDERGMTVVERFTTDDGSLNNSDDFIVAYAADRPDVARELGVEQLVSFTIDIAGDASSTGVRAAQVVFTTAAGALVSQTFACSAPLLAPSLARR